MRHLPETVRLLFCSAETSGSGHQKDGKQAIRKWPKRKAPAGKVPEKKDQKAAGVSAGLLNSRVKLFPILLSNILTVLFGRAMQTALKA